MPSIPNVEGQPKKVMVQPPVELDGEQAPSPTAKPIPKPEPAAPLPVPKSQDQLALESVTQQTVRKRNEMTPVTSPTATSPTSPETVKILPIDQPVNKLYEFTDADRKAAVSRSSAIRNESKFDWENTDLEEALQQLAALRAEAERGGIILQRRTSDNKVETVKCFGCDNVINISEGRYAGMRTRNNFETGLPESAYACSARCFIFLSRDFSHPTNRPSPTQVG